MSQKDLETNPRQLLVDAAGSYLLLALMQGKMILDSEITSSREGAGEILTRLARSGWLESGSFNRVILGGGPGSYTGLRVALSSGGSLAFAWKCPLVLVSSLAAYALEGEKSVSCLDARAGGVYLQLFEDGVALSPSMRWSDEELKGEDAIQGMDPVALRQLPWRGPDSEALAKRLTGVCDWKQQMPHTYGFVKMTTHPSAREYLPPFQGVRLDYLKEDDQVAHKREEKAHG